MGCNASGDREEESDSENEIEEIIQPKLYKTLDFIRAEQEPTPFQFAMAAAPGRGWSRTNSVKKRVSDWMLTQDEFKEKKELLDSLVKWIKKVELTGKILFDLLLEHDEEEGYFLDEDLVEEKEKPEALQAGFEGATPEICEVLFKFRTAHAKEFMKEDDKKRMLRWACMKEWQKGMGEITCMCPVGLNKVCYGDNNGRVRIRHFVPPFDGWLSSTDRESEAPVGGFILDLMNVIPSHYKGGKPSDEKFGISHITFVASPEYKSGFLCGTCHPTLEGDAETSTKQNMYAIHAWDVAQLIPIDHPHYNPSFLCKGPEEPAVITNCGEHIVAACTKTGTIYWTKLEAVKLEPMAEGAFKPAELEMKKYEDSKDAVLAMTSLSDGKHFVASCAGGKLKMFSIEGGELKAVGETKTAKDADCSLVMHFPKEENGEKGASIIACDGKTGFTVAGLKDEGGFDGKDPASYEIGGEGKAGNNFQTTSIAPIKGTIMAMGGADGTLLIFSLESDGKFERLKKFDGVHTSQINGIVSRGRTVRRIYCGSKCEKVAVFGTFTQKLKDARDELES